MSRQTIIASVAASLAVAGCGTRATRPDAALRIAASLPVEIHDAHKGTLRRVTCVRQTGQVFRCVGTYAPSRAAIEAQYKGEGVSAADVTTLHHRSAGGSPAALTVTLEPRDGSYVYEFD